MPGRSQTWRGGFYSSLMVACVLWAIALSVAVAQPCTAPLPSVTSTEEAINGVKFKLIARKCSVFAVPEAVHRAAQLDLYGPGTSVAIPTPSADAGLADRRPSALPSVVALPTLPTLPTRGATRVMSLAPTLIAAAKAYNIDPLLLHAIAHVESRHKTSAVSKAGALGVMQVMPATARRFGVDDPERALLDARTNLRASAAYLAKLRSRYSDNLRLMLAAYNAGEGAVDKHGRNVPPYAETQAYVRDVLAIYQRLTASFTLTTSGALVVRGGRS